MTPTLIPSYATTYYSYRNALKSKLGYTRKPNKSKKQKDKELKQRFNKKFHTKYFEKEIASGKFAKKHPVLAEILSNPFYKNRKIIKIRNPYYNPSARFKSRGRRK